VSPRGRRAALPPAGHSRPEPLSAAGLIVAHANRHGQVKSYDFAALPAAPPLQRSLAVLFAAKCTPQTWESHATSEGYWHYLKEFTEFLSGQQEPPGDLDGLSTAVVKRWRASLPGTTGGYSKFSFIARLLLTDTRLQSGPVAETLAARFPRPKSSIQSYSQAEFDQIQMAARRQFRAALLRINDNAAHLEQWRAGAFSVGTSEWILGEGLDFLARTGDLPRTECRNGSRTVCYRYGKAFGGTAAGQTWQRLFLSRMEATALGVLLMAEYGWNLAVIDIATVPRSSPDPGEDGHPTYRIPIEKRRRGNGLIYETRNVTDDGAASRGRLITQALEATRFARAIVEDRAPGTDLLVVWRAHREQDVTDSDRRPPVGPFSFGIARRQGTLWGQAEGLGGSPFRRGRRTVLAVDRREPAQHTQATHDRDYALADRRVQADAVDVIAAGAQDAADHACQVVLAAQLRDQPVPGDLETATADCSDFTNSPYPGPGGGCGASFLMCLGCQNARVHPGHHPRLALLDQALANQRSVLPPPAWTRDWGDTFTRLQDLKHKIGDGPWALACARATDRDRGLVDLLLTGSLDP
jgi:hypothetical protein